MRKFRWYVGVFLFVLACCCLEGGKASKAQERPLYLVNGQTAQENDEFVEDGDLYQVGDTGEIRIAYEGIWPTGQIATMQFVSSNPAIVQVDAAGRFNVIGGGKAIVTVTGISSEGAVIFSASYCFRCCADLSGSDLAQKKINSFILNENMWNVAEKVIPFVNMPDLAYHTFTWSSSNVETSITCELDSVNKQLKILSPQEGTETVTITINNKTFTLVVHTYGISMNKVSALLTEKETVSLKVRGYAGKVTWKTLKKKVASVSSKGVVKAKATGNVVVYAEIEDNRLGCAISVVKPEIKKVVNAAKNIAKGTYSQPRRMQKGYYDCSSLVWRAYKKIGKYFGDRGYAPVAANIAKYLFDRKKRISGGLNGKNIREVKLRPGDLLFRPGAKNGRYKGIYHVEMFIGYQCEGFDSQGKPVLGILWAARPANYGGYGEPVGRP